MTTLQVNVWQICGRMEKIAMALEELRIARAQRLVTEEDYLDQREKLRSQFRELELELDKLLEVPQP